MLTSDIIAARATPSGHAGRAIVRLSGAGVFDVLKELGCRADARDRGVTPEVLRLWDRASLACLVMRYPAPRSYTGEESAEVCLAGGTLLVERVLDAIIALPGVRAAQAGEFTARAFAHGRLTLEQAEGVAATIAANHEEELRAASELLRGDRGAIYRAWSEDLADMLALLEAGIDFSDQEDVRPIKAADLRRRLARLAEAMIHDAGTASGRGAEDAGPLVVLCGRANAGKSTLFNALLGRARAVTSPLAGSTRDVIEERLELGTVRPGAGAVRLCDMAGLMEQGAGESASDIAARERAREALDRADMVLWCDPTGAFDARDAHAWGLDTARCVVRVRTFADRGAGEHEEQDHVPVCALDGWNLGMLRRTIAERACAPEGGRTLPRRHREAIRQCCADVNEAQALLEGEQEHAFPRGAEVIAAALRSALDELGELTGQVTRDDVIGRVFASFCVGK